MATAGGRHLPRGVDESLLYDNLKSPAVAWHAPHSRTCRGERGGAGLPKPIPGPNPIIPNGVPMEKYGAVGGAEGAGRVDPVVGEASAEGARRAVQAFTLLRKRAPRATLVVAARRAGRCSGRPNGTGLPVDLVGVEVLAGSPTRRSPSWPGGRDRLRAIAGGRELRHRAGRGDGRRRAVAASDLPGYRRVLRDGQAGRLTPPGDLVALADALYDLLEDEESGGASLPPAAPPRPSSPGVASPAASIEAYEDALAAPRVRGLHGLPGRPSFGGAMLEYAVWLHESGYRTGAPSSATAPAPADARCRPVHRPRRFANGRRCRFAADWAVR